MGPLVSQVHLEKVRSYVTQAKKDGGHIHCGETVEKLVLSPQHEKVIL